MRWLLDGNSVALQGQTALARLDLARPRRGLTDWSLDGARPIDARLLGIEIEGVPTETYLREGDLFAVYEPTADRPNRVEACWRILSSSEPAALPHIELQVSVQTSLLDSYPCLDCGSEIPTNDCWRLSLNGQFTPPASSPVTWTPQTSQACTLGRHVGTRELSYCELVYPADFRVDHCRPAERTGAVSLRHELFPEFLEKGVILRSRLRGIWLPAAGDVEQALAAWREFQTSPLPLTA